MIDENSVYLSKTSTSTSRFRQEIGVEDIVGIVRHRKLIFYSCLAFFVCLSLVYSFILPIRYESVGRLTVDVSSLGTLGPQAQAFAQATGVDPATALQTQVNILETDAMAWDVITRLRLDRSPEAAKRRYLIGPIECMSPMDLPVDRISAECKR